MPLAPLELDAYDLDREMINLASCFGSEQVNVSEVKQRIRKIINQVGSPPFAAWRDKATDQTILHKAILKRRSDLIPCILESARDRQDELLFAGQHGRTALNLAAYTGQVDCIRILIGAAREKRAQLLLARDGSGNTALHRAAYNGKTDCVRLLIEAAGDNLAQLLLATQTSKQRGNTALHLAAMYDRVDCVCLLLEMAGETQSELFCTKDEDGCTAIDWARSKGHMDSVKLLEAVADRIS